MEAQIILKFLTSILKKYSVPEFTGVKFLSEDVTWIEVGKHYDFVFINKSIYECDYQSGRLRANDKPIKFASPL
jgi:hypothetical protein